MSERRGFTLIELLVVIAIIAILAAILFPVFSRARVRAHTARCINNLKQLGVAIRMYADDNQGWYPDAWYGNAPEQNWCGNEGPGKWTWPERGQLNSYVRSPAIFLCPSSRRRPASSIIYVPTVPGKRLTSRDYPLSYSMNFSFSRHKPLFNPEQKPDAMEFIDPGRVMLLIEEARDNSTGGIGINDCVYVTDRFYQSDTPDIVHYDGTNILYMDGRAKWDRAEKLRKEQDDGLWKPIIR